MRRLTFWNSRDLKQLKSGIEVILQFCVCFNAVPMWACIKDSCKQLFLLQDSMAQSKAVCSDCARIPNQGRLWEKRILHREALAYHGRKLTHAIQKRILIEKICVGERTLISHWGPFENLHPALLLCAHVNKMRTQNMIYLRNIQDSCSKS